MKTQDSQPEQLELFPLMEKPYDVPMITPLIMPMKEENDQTSKN